MERPSLRWLLCGHQRGSCSASSTSRSWWSCSTRSTRTVGVVAADRSRRRRGSRWHGRTRRCESPSSTRSWSASGDGDRAGARDRSPPSRWHRSTFFGRDAISFALVLPIALPGHRDRTRAVVDGRCDARSGLRHPRDHRRARDVLHRGRVQQRGRAPAADVRLARRGIDGPRGRRPDDLPLRDVPGDPHGRRSRGPPGLRAVVRRDHRHDLPGRHDQTLPIWIFNNISVPFESAGGDRRRDRGRS